MRIAFVPHRTWDAFSLPQHMREGIMDFVFVRTLRTFLGPAYFAYHTYSALKASKDCNLTPATTAPLRGIHHPLWSEFLLNLLVIQTLNLRSSIHGF